MQVLDIAIFCYIWLMKLTEHVAQIIATIPNNKVTMKSTSFESVLNYIQQEV
jgi:hypothetical protein